MLCPSPSAGPSAGSMWCLRKAFLEGQTTRMQSCVLPPEPLRAVMIGPTRMCRLVLPLSSSYLEIDTCVIARLGMGVRLGTDLTVRDFRVISGQPKLDSVSNSALLVRCSCPVCDGSFPKRVFCPKSQRRREQINRWNTLTPSLFVGRLLILVKAA